MKLIRFAQNSLYMVLSFSIFFSFSACAITSDGVFSAEEDEPISVSNSENSVFTNYSFSTNEDGNLVSNSGTEYSLLAYEGALFYLGNLEFQGSVRGENKVSMHFGLYRTGLFSIEGDDKHDILIRYLPNNEWFSIYRNTSLSPFDFSVDNCTRLELVSGIGNAENDAAHTTCGKGISAPSEIAEFLSDIRSQQSPREAGLYDMITKPDGMLENCYVYAVIYGFFEEEPNLAVRMTVTSYNDLAYSVSVDDCEYVLPEAWLERLQCN